jgi:hypothetical protein
MNFTAPRFTSFTASGLDGLGSPLGSQRGQRPQTKINLTTKDTKSTKEFSLRFCLFLPNLRNLRGQEGPGPILVETSLAPR